MFSRPLRVSESKWSSRHLRRHLHQSSMGFSFAVLTLVGVLAFLAGSYFSSPTKHSDLYFPLQPAVPWIYNNTFGAEPSELSDTAWASLFPQQGGFFKHPRLAPERSALAVFHQLHCLNGLRHAVFHNVAVDTSGPEHHHARGMDAKHMLDPRHLRHCIDLIRQALMCQPDLVVEVKSHALGGVTGFGTAHACVNWHEVLDWVDEWEGWNE